VRKFSRPCQAGGQAAPLGQRGGHASFRLAATLLAHKARCASPRSLREQQVFGGPMLKTILRVTCFIGLMTGTQAEQGVLSGTEITDLVAGASVEIDTPVGSKLPVRYAPDGQLSGQAGQ